MAKQLQSKRQRKSKAQLAQWLRDQGISPGKIISAQVKQRKGMVREVCGVSDAAYIAAGGTLTE